MKKLIMLVVAAMMVTVSASAQNDDLKNEIGVYYGLGSCSGIVSIIGHAFGSSLGEQSSFWGPVGVEYYYHVTPVVALGAMASIAGCEWGDSGYFKTKFYTVMPAVKFNWLRRNHFGMYSGVALGFMHVTDKYSGPDKNRYEDDSVTTFMAHGTAIGIEFGGALRGFGEVGFGERGLLCLGLRYKF